MARKDALMKLHRRLLDRRSELLRTLGDELGELRHDVGDTGAGDNVDSATASLNSDMLSQLAELDSQEVVQIDRAIARLVEGTYGQCEACDKRIPVGRLDALPYSTLCIECQREMETNPDLLIERRETRAWQKVYDAESANREVTLNPNDLEYGMG